MTIKDQKCPVRFSIRMHPLQCLFSIYLIFTDNSIKLSRSILLNNVFRYVSLAIMYYTYIQNAMTALGVLEILTHDTFDGRPLHILEYNFVEIGKYCPILD